MAFKKYSNRVKKFNRVEKLNYKKAFFKLYIDRNDSIYDVTECYVASWKTIQKGKSKISVPDIVTETRNVHLFNKVKGNPSKIAISKICAEIDASALVI